MNRKFTVQVGANIWEFDQIEPAMAKGYSEATKLATDQGVPQVVFLLTEIRQDTWTVSLDPK